MSRRHIGWCTAILAIGVAALVGTASAAAPAAAPQPPAYPAALEAAGSGAAANGMSVMQIMHIGGGVMWVIAAMSLLTLTFVIYFFIVIRPAQVAPESLQREVVTRIMAGSLDDARLACVKQPCPLSAVTTVALDTVKKMPDLSMAMLKDIMEGEGSRHAEALQGQTQYLLDIAVISPMIGLLGTVVGLLQAFSAVALDVASAKPVALSMGVSKALFATAFGLIVGIPAMAFYGFFRRKASKVVSQLEGAAVDILTALSVKRTK